MILLYTPIQIHTVFKGEGYLMLEINRYRIHSGKPKALIKFIHQHISLFQLPNKTRYTLTLGIALQPFIIYFPQPIFGRFIALHQGK